MGHDEFVSRKEIQDKLDLMDHINFFVTKWFYEAKLNNISQWIPKIHVQLVWSPI